MNNLILIEDGSLIRANEFTKTVDSQIIEFGSDIDSPDIWLDNFVRSKILKDFDNIFVPTSFGTTTSDFLGLRLAMHIRTTENHPSQLSNLYLYGPVTLKELVTLGGELYQLISTKGLDVIDYSWSAISDNLNKKKILLNKKDLRSELNKITLNIPKDLYDSHSIANIWGAFRLAKVANINTEDIPSLQNNVEKLKSIYFKWLMLVNDSVSIRNKEVEKTEKVSNRKLDGLTVKGYVDLNKHS